LFNIIFYRIVHCKLLRRFS